MAGGSPGLLDSPTTILGENKTVSKKPLVFGIIGVIVLTGGCIAAYIDVRSIFIKAFPFIPISLILIISGVKRKTPLAIVLGVAGSIIIITIALIILIYDLSPSQAQEPIPPIGAVATIGYLILDGVFLNSGRQKINASKIR